MPVAVPTTIASAMQAVKLEPDNANRTAKSCRDDFPLLDARPDVLYLNGSFQQPLSAPVHAACTAFLDQHLHEPSPKASWTNKVDQCRKEVAEHLHTNAENIAFMKNTSEGLAMFIRSCKWEAGDNVVLLDDEHPNQLYAWLALESIGVEVRRVPAVTWASTKEFFPRVDAHTRAVGLSWVMFHSGQRNDVEGICAHFRPLGVHVLVDATQAVGVADLDLSRIKPSALAFSAHKALGTPCGQGVLYVDSDLIEELVPPSVGPFGVTDLPASFIAGKDISSLQPNGKRFETGNFNYIALHGLSAYLNLLSSYGGMTVVEKSLYDLSEYLIDEMVSLGIECVSARDRSRRSPHSVVFPLVNARWAEYFKENQIMVSHYRAGTRVSIGVYNNREDINRFTVHVAAALALGIPVS